MAITFVSAGSFGSGAAGTISPAPSIPAGTQADDIMLLFVESANQAVTAPAGWSTASAGSGFGTAASTTAELLQCFWKRHTGSESAPSITAVGDHALAVIVAFRGVVNSGNPWDATPVASFASTSNTGVTFPTVTTTTNGCLIVGGVANFFDGSNTISGYANANLTGIAEHADSSTSTGNGGNIAVFSGTQTTAGATGTTSAAAAGGAGKCYVVVPLKPAASTAVVTGHVTTAIPVAVSGAWSR